MMHPVCEKTSVSLKYTYYVMANYEPKLKDEWGCDLKF